MSAKQSFGDKRVPKPELGNEENSRQPMIYRRKEGGTFLLYGVGKNRVDDGGVIDAKGSDGERPDFIWLYAPPAR